MRRSRADKALTHSKILAVAAKRFRERGLEGIGLAEVMEEAGSSVGGFYKHFSSREELVTESLAEAFKFLDRMESKSKDLPTLLESFLSDEHYGAAGSGCALTALANDMSRASGAARTIYTQRLKQTLCYYAERLDQSSDAAKRSRAILLFSAVSGGLALARAVNDASLADEILEALRTQVAALLEPAASQVTAPEKPQNTAPVKRPPKRSKR